MNRSFLGILALFVFATGSLSAHHGRGSAYDNSKVETVEGTVSEWAYRNPHAALYVDVKGKDGQVVNWAFESQNVSSLSRLRVFRNTFRTGQQVTVRYNPSRGGAPVGVIRRVYDASGKELLAFGGSIDE
jgi:hypothetical protein